MEYNVNFENENYVENKKLSKIFSKEVVKNVNLLTSYTDYESYIVDCIKHTFHILKMQNILGKSQKVKDKFDFCIFCSDYMKVGEFKRTLCCGHIFHKKCIDKYIYKFYASQCPCCKCEIK